jgi:hypothetical protein
MTGSYDGGGWMLALKASTSSTYFWIYCQLLDSIKYIQFFLQQIEITATLKFDVMNYYRAKDMLAIWPDITTGNRW